MAANRERAFTQSSRPAPPLDQQRVIAEQTEAFLARGGEIQQIPNGVSGQVGFGAPRTTGNIPPAKTAS
jgi:hypothetical protein